MISFAPEEDERLLAESARSFAADFLRPRLREHEAARAVSEEARRTFHSLGLVGMDLPEELGFGGISLVARALAEEELAAGDLGAAVALDATGLACEVLRAFPGQRKRLLTPFLDDPLRRAALVVGRLTLGGARAQLLVRIDGDAWAAEGAAGAVEDRDVLGIAELPPAVVQVSGGERLGDARAALKAALLRYAGVNSARAVGCARAAFEHALAYAEERTAFGKPIGHFQAIAFLLADMATEIEGARALTWRACRAHDLGAADAPFRLAQARAHSSEMLDFVTSNAVQILGGAGFLQDHPVEKWMRDARVLAQMGLTAEAARASDFSCEGALT
jgi:alkylation response protein AidB-like acyl-CoA dehydrogenase